MIQKLSLMWHALILFEMVCFKGHWLNRSIAVNVDV